VGGVFSITLTENIINHHLGGIDQKDHRLISSVVNQSQHRGSEDGMFEVTLHLDLLGTKDKGLELSGEDNEGIGEEGKVVDKDAKDSYSSEESLNIRKVSTGTPIQYFCDVQ